MLQQLNVKEFKNYCNWPLRQEKKTFKINKRFPCFACLEYLITHQSREAFSDTASDGAWQIVDLLAELLGCAGYCKILVKLVTIHLEFTGEVVGNVIAEKRKLQTMSYCCMIHKSDIVSRNFPWSIIFILFRFFNIFWTVKSMHVIFHLKRDRPPYLKLI